MALDFPANPTNGQAYGNFIYSSSKEAWQAKPLSGAKTSTGDVPPTSPVNGDQWFNTSDGTLYIYVVDSDTSQWVEHRSEIARSQVGLVPLVPTSITVGSGTGTVYTNGAVTFSGVSSLSFNGIFSSAYKNYRLLATDITRDSGYGSLGLRLRSGTSDNTANSYYQYWTMKRLSGVSQDNTGGPSTSYTLVGFDNNTAYSWNFQGEINAPFSTRNTTISGQGFGADATSTYMVNSTVLHTVSSSFDGITFLPSGGTMSGTIKIYGYN